MLGHTAIGLALAVGGVPPSLAQDSRGLERCKSTGTGIEAEVRQTDPRPGSNTGVSVEVPMGSVCVGPEFVGGVEPVYVRRTAAGEGITIVEVSTAPFMPVLDSTGVGGSIVRPDQPASW